jgi:hypothetical protein
MLSYHLWEDCWQQIQIAEAGVFDDIVINASLEGFNSKLLGASPG